MYFTGTPEWLDRPENEDKVENEEATFRCEAKYANYYKWFVNGVPLEDSKFFVISIREIVCQTNVA